MNPRILGHLLVAAGALLLVAPLAARGQHAWQQQRLLRQFEQQLAEARGGAALGEAVAAPAPPGAVNAWEPIFPEAREAPAEGPALGPERGADRPAAQPPAAAPAPAPRGPLFRLELPSLGAAFVVLAGIENEDLARGPGHYPRTPLPGSEGNAAIAAHRTYGGQPSYFYHLDRLREGDTIRVTYPDRTLTYTVERVWVTDPFDVAVLDPVGYPALTLTTCDPPGTEDNRLIVRARLNTPVD